MPTALSTKQINTVAQLLKALEPGQLPLDIFMEVTRLTVTAVAEVVPLRQEQNDHISVLLLQRPDNDPNWPGMLHIPGAIILPQDTEGDAHDALKRIVTGKLTTTETSTPVFVKNSICRVSRGTELAAVYYVEILSEPTAGILVDSDHLPENIIEGQREFIQAAAEKYKADKL